MALQISYIERFEHVLEPAVEFLSRDRDLFAKPRIVVPTAGAKAWLWSELARKLGASGGGDGIVANVEISYPGTILSLLLPARGREVDPWSFDRLTFTVLEVVAGPSAGSLEIPFEVSGEPLLAARRIAGLFDEYHVRRPAMIARWQAGQEVLSPVATQSRAVGDDWAAEKLGGNDGWQHRVWRAVVERIGSGPLDRLSVDNLASREPLFVAGLQSLSLQQIKSLEKIATACEVEALLVHPSRPLAARWRKTLPPVSKDVPPAREPAELPEDIDPLVATWLHGARETQVLLASQGWRPEHREATHPAAGEPAAPAPPSLLARMQRSITTAEKPVAEPHDLVADRSFTVHRCHSLSRQAEVLHDAVLHAFHDLKNLQPHEVVIVSPCLEDLAPHLEAVFAREVADDDGTKVKLSLVVADRGLSEVSEAARLLVDLLGLVGSRCSIAEFRKVATHPLVQQHFHLDDDTIATWDRLVERTAIRWGLDASHRLREQFPPAAAEAHTWRAGIERMLLGATLPDEDPRPELGGTVPLDDVPVDSLEAIGPLVCIYETVSRLDEARAQARPAAEWCGLIEEAIFGLCGTEPRELAEPLRTIRSFAVASSATPVPFADVRAILVEQLESVVGRQPLRTGAITATSMVPLRDVPFRVVCVAGYDDGKVGGAEPKGDDLVARQSLAGDGDPRTDTRRALLDCLLAARERFVVACNGMNIKNNVPLPLVTPLAELVDFAVRHGVPRPDPAQPSAIEVKHPRHAVGRRNFEPGTVQKGITWSHDTAALAVSQAVEQEERYRVTHSGDAQPLPVIELSMLEEMVRDPLKLYMQKTLGMSTWRDDEDFPAATIPLDVSKKDRRQLAEELLRMLTQGTGTEKTWKAAVKAASRVPLDPFGDAVIDEVTRLVKGIRDIADDPNDPVPIARLKKMPVRVTLPGSVLTGDLPGVTEDETLIVEVRFSDGRKQAWGLPIHVAALRLLVAYASGFAPEAAVVIARHERWKAPTFPGNPAIKREVTLSEALRTKTAATERLAAICSLLQQALAGPCGRFGGNAAKIVEDILAGRAVAAKKRFQGYVESSLEGTNEEIVYGRSPRFEDVFNETSPEFTFNREFERLLGVPANSYELQ